MEPTVTMSIAKWSNGVWQAEKDVVVREDVVTVYVNEHELVRLHCSLDYPAELAVGYLKAARLINQKSDLRELRIVPEERSVYVWTAESATTAAVPAPSAVTSGCGQGPAFYHCWQSSFELAPVTSTFKLNPEGVLRLIRELHQRSALFKLTGGVHSAALGGAQDLAIFRQDIGRHNAVDKVIGHTILSDVATTDKVLVISGRISSDIILKAVLAGLPLVVSPSAPTHLAVELARRLGITVVGFARGTRLSVYSEVWRLQRD